MDIKEVTSLIESIRIETRNASITPGRMATVLAELLRLLQWEEEERELAVTTLNRELLKEFARQMKGLREELLARIAEFDEVYYYEEEWDRLSVQDQQRIIERVPRLYILEGSRPTPEPPPEPMDADYDEETGILSVPDATYDSATGIVTLMGDYDESTGIITLTTAPPKPVAAYDEESGIITADGVYDAESGIVTLQGEYNNDGIITL